MSGEGDESKLDWEMIGRELWNFGHSVKMRRAKVFGGWLVQQSPHYDAGLTFIPDPKYEWKLGKMKTDPHRFDEAGKPK